MTATGSEQLQRLLNEVDADRLMDATRTIAQWVRLSGSEEERKAFEFLRGELDALGYRTELHEPVCLVSLPGKASLTISDSGENLYCITHSFSVSTDTSGIEAELVYAGGGKDEDYAGLDVRGKIALVEGLATPNKVGPAEAAGAVAVIHNSGAHIHEMTISPVWGSPTVDTLHLLPKLPHISVDQETAGKLRERIDPGSVSVRVSTEVDTGWRPIPLLIADMSDLDEQPIHVLFSGHVDGWHYGAMDNGSANSAMLECARILKQNQANLIRPIRLAFWSGHSHARYATSTWYADQFWKLLHNFCVAHVNIDSPGGVGATNLSSSNTMAESYPLAKEVFKKVAGADLHYARIGRLGDQSFWGAGVPALYCSLSQQETAEHATGISALTGRGGGLGWWWHTPDDTMDKLDPDNLQRDTRILLATLYRLCTEPRLPFDQTGPANEVLEELTAINGETVDELGLAPVIEEARKLVESAQRLNELDLGDDPSEDELALVNGCIAGVSRILMPVNYTASGEFEHDSALLGSSGLPGLQRARQLSSLSDNANEYYPLLNKMRRERNRVMQAVAEARALIDQTVAVFEMED